MNKFIAKATLYDEKEYPNSYLLLDTPASDGKSGLDIILLANETQKLWYNTDYDVKDIVVVKEVNNLDELVDYMKGKNIDLSNMVTELGIPIGSNNMLSYNLNQYIIEDYDKLLEKLEDKLTDEIYEYKNDLCYEGANSIFENAYEYGIKDSLSCYTIDYIDCCVPENEQKSFIINLLNKENTLDYLYDKFQIDRENQELFQDSLDNALFDARIDTKEKSNDEEEI